jgi:hypothetical protein
MTTPKKRRITRLAGGFLTDLVMLVLLVAAAMKLSDLTSFVESLETWELLPRRILPWVAFGVPLTELGLGLGWFLRLERRWIPRLALVLLLAFSGLFGAHVALGSPPDCACFGKFLAFKDSVTESTAVIVRNGALLATLVAGMALSRRSRSGMIPIAA